MKQMTLAAGASFEKHMRPTRKAEFLSRMESLMPWAEFGIFRIFRDRPRLLRIFRDRPRLLAPCNVIIDDITWREREFSETPMKEVKRENT